MFLSADARPAALNELSTISTRVLLYLQPFLQTLICHLQTLARDTSEILYDLEWLW